MAGQTTIYDHYKFLTKEELERLNLTNLIGTNLLRAYMHGFFINYSLYKKVGFPWQYFFEKISDYRHELELLRCSDLSFFCLAD